MAQRKSNIELLRILSVLLIIAHHFSVHGGFYFSGDTITGNMAFLQLLSIGGKIGVNLFVLITGYFTIRAKGGSFGKAMTIWLQVFFYSVVIYVLAWATGLTVFSWKGLIGALFPILSNQWWFASAWMILYLLSGWLNKGLRAISRRGYLLLLLGFGSLWYLIPVLTWLPGRLREILWFLFLYCLVGFLRLHSREGHRNLWLGLGIGLFFVTFAVGLLGMEAARVRPVYETTYFDAHHILILLSSVCIFRGVLAWELGNHPVICQAAKYSFGIYLLHDSNYVRYPLWQGLLRCADFRDSPWLAAYALAAVALVFGSCLALEALRSRSLDGVFADLAGRAEAGLWKRNLRG